MAVAPAPRTRRTHARLAARRAAAAMLVAALAALALLPAAARAQAPRVAPITLNGLQNATYPSDYTASGTATLDNGRYTGAGRSGAGEVTVGFVTNAVAPAFAAVALSTQTPGGAFATLHLVTEIDGVLSASPGVALGEGVDVRSIAIVGDRVTVTLLEPGAAAETVRTFVRAADGFRAAADTGPSPAPSATGSAGELGGGGALSGPAALALVLVTLVTVAAARRVTRPR